jgi:hypothetical protein
VRTSEQTGYDSCRGHLPDWLRCALDRIHVPSCLYDLRRDFCRGRINCRRGWCLDVGSPFIPPRRETTVGRALRDRRPSQHGPVRTGPKVALCNGAETHGTRGPVGARTSNIEDERQPESRQRACRATRPTKLPPAGPARPPAAASQTASRVCVGGRREGAVTSKAHRDSRP